MTNEILSQINSRIKAITELEIKALENNHKTESSKLNAIKIELLDLNIFVCDLAQENIRKQLTQ